MPKLRRREEALRQVLIAAEIMKRRLKNKLGDFTETIVGKGESADVLGSRDGKGLKPVFLQAVKHFSINRFTDMDCEYVFEILDPKKPLIKVKKLE